MRITVEIEGINLEKLLRAAADAGILVTQARRNGPRQMCIGVYWWQMAQLRALCARSGWQIREIREGLAVRAGRFVRRRKALMLSLSLGVLLVGLSGRMILDVRIDHAQEHRAEVQRALDEEGVHPGRLKGAFSLDELRARLALRLPGLSFVGLRYAGSTLICDCHQATMEEAADVPGEGMDIVAGESGIVTYISAGSGTPRVTPGQAVHRGQVLIAGVERTQGGVLHAVQAQGQVRARVYARGEARVSMNQTATVETGRTRTRVTLCTPWQTRRIRDAQPFDLQDVSRERLKLVGLYLPVWRETETFSEIEVFTSPRNPGDAASMAQGAAEKMAREQCPYGASILDKWVSCSVYHDDGHGDYVVATVIIEYERSIAAREKGLQEARKHGDTSQSLP